MDTPKRGMAEERFHRKGDRDLSHKITCACERDVIYPRLQKGKSVAEDKYMFVLLCPKRYSLTRCALLTTWDCVRTE